MKIIRHTGVFHFWPYCCAEKLVDGKYKKVNWLWLFWMFCFSHNEPPDPDADRDKPLKESLKKAG